MGICASACSDPAEKKNSKKKTAQKKSLRKSADKKLNKPVVMCGNLEKQAVKESSFEELCDLLDEEVDEKNMTKKELEKTKRRLSKRASQIGGNPIVQKRESKLGMSVENLLTNRDTSRRTSRLSLSAAPISLSENNTSSQEEKPELDKLFGKIQKNRQKKGF
ncbi:unnamed protein product [Oikopleura dioica]|uniref:Uncharacterized protein n=1 Tax=Oikopleura dioica TaxID=34765 RepID=E4YHF6_OIKDI|nr:unnamed protein product [Oikopleura dioica]